MNSNSSKKRVSRVGKQKEQTQQNMPLDEDYVNDIMKSMDSLHTSEQSVRAYQQKTASTNKKIILEDGYMDPNMAAKQKKYFQNKSFPLMQKCQRNLTYLKKNRCIPKPRAHVGKIPRPIKDPNLNSFKCFQPTLKVSRTEVKRKVVSPLRNNFVQCDETSNSFKYGASEPNSSQFDKSTADDATVSVSQPHNFESTSEDSDGDFEKFIKMHSVANDEPYSRKRRVKGHKKRRKDGTPVKVSLKTARVTRRTLSDTSDSLSTSSQKMKECNSRISTPLKEMQTDTVESSSDDEQFNNNSCSSLDEDTDFDRVESLENSSKPVDKPKFMKIKDKVDKLPLANKDGFKNISSSSQVSSTPSNLLYNALVSAQSSEDSGSSVQHNLSNMVLPGKVLQDIENVIINYSKGCTQTDNTKYSTPNCSDLGFSSDCFTNRVNSQSNVNLPYDNVSSTSVGTEDEIICIPSNSIEMSEQMKRSESPNSTTSQQIAFSPSFKEAHIANNYSNSLNKPNEIPLTNSDSVESFCPKILSVQSINTSDFSELIILSDDDSEEKCQESKKEIIFEPNKIEDHCSLKLSNDLQPDHTKVQNEESSPYIQDECVVLTDVNILSVKTCQNNQVGHVPNSETNNVISNTSLKVPKDDIFDVLKKIDFDSIKKFTGDNENTFAEQNLSSGASDDHLSTVGSCKQLEISAPLKQPESINNSSIQRFSNVKCCEKQIQPPKSFTSTPLNTPKCVPEVILIEDDENEEKCTTDVKVPWVIEDESTNHDKEMEPECPADELDKIASENIQGLNSKQKNDIIPLLELYNAEYSKYIDIRNTEKNVSAGLKMLEEEQVKKITHIRTSIKNFLQYDSCFLKLSNNPSLTEKDLVKNVEAVNNASSNTFLPELESEKQIKNEIQSRKEKSFHQASGQSTSNPLKRKASNSSNQPVCAECGKGAVATCQGCGLVYFCSTECGKKFWDRRHYAECKAIVIM